MRLSGHSAGAWSRAVPRLAGTLALAGAVVALALSGFEATSAQPTNPGPAQASGDVKRGEYLVTVIGCNDCHTPLKLNAQGMPEPDMSRMLSGHPESVKMPPAPTLEAGPWQWVGGATNTVFAGPWGVTYATNLTPDENTGLGIWTEDMFVRALRTGRHMGTSRPIQPPMPWPWLSKMTDEDLKAMYAYLRTIPPIVNHVPDYAPPPEPEKK
jgi:mono/diheme cytochrome c family protein